MTPSRHAVASLPNYRAIAAASDARQPVPRPSLSGCPAIQRKRPLESKTRRQPTDAWSGRSRPARGPIRTASEARKEPRQLRGGGRGSLGRPEFVIEIGDKLGEGPIAENVVDCGFDGGAIGEAGTPAGGDGRHLVEDHLADGLRLGHFVWASLPLFGEPNCPADGLEYVLYCGQRQAQKPATLLLSDSLVGLRIESSTCGHSAPLGARRHLNLPPRETEAR